MAALTAEQVAQIASAEEVQVLIRLVEAVVQEVPFGEYSPARAAKVMVVATESWRWPIGWLMPKQ